METIATVSGWTEWSATEYKTVGRFRGSATIKVAARDAKGRPAMAARRGVRITIATPDGVRYVFQADMTEFMREHIGDNMNPGCTLVVHGMRHSISVRYERVPNFILDAYRKASRPVRAVLRLHSRALWALPTHRPLPAKLAKVST